METVGGSAVQPEIEAFADVARRYCRLMEEAHRLPLRERMEAFAVVLGELCSRAVSLPDLEPSERGPGRDEPPALPEWPGFDRYDWYWEVFDPYQHEEPVEAALSDDLLDIHRDLVTGLRLLDTGAAADIADAVWDWRFLFYMHWGRHATGALRALHSALADLIDP